MYGATRSKGGKEDVQVVVVGSRGSPFQHALKFLYIFIAYGITYAFYTLIDNYQLSSFVVIIIGSTLVHHATFWSLGLCLMWLDLTRQPSSLYKCKIQKNGVVGWEEYVKCIKMVLFNQHIANLPCLLLMYPLYTHAGLLSSGPMPSFLEIMKGWMICLLVEEVMFYYSHRAFHHGSIYKYIHKRHHDFSAPVGISAEYAHPIESIVSNTLPVLCGPLATAYLFPGTHVSLLFFWLFVAVSSTLNSHCGYDFPYSIMGDAKIHDFHHSSFRDNYGVLGLLDWLHNTNANFNKHIEQLENKLRKQEKKKM